MNDIRLGIIGISEGNGHPYSWSAIFNGYNPVFMDNCPYPVIKNYLAKQSFPEDAIPGASVTHIWTQDKEQSSDIAQASNIPNVVDHYEDMIGEIDGLLLARDDSENHLQYALPFIKRGVPIYIDKPLATNIADAKKILSLQQYDWQIFTCSALRYAAEFQISKEEIESLGGIGYIEATVPKSWEKYAIHVLEPVSQMINIELSAITEHHLLKTAEICQLSLLMQNGCMINLQSFGSIVSDISILIKGKDGQKRMAFSDSFFAFKQALVSFIKTIQDEKLYIPREETLAIIHLIELGTNANGNE